MNLKQSAFSAIRWTTFAMIVNTGLQFAQMAILARLLVPSDFGLMAMVMAVMAFVHVFTDLGVSNAIIHHQEISEEELSSLYWLNFLVGAILALILMLGSYPISSYLFNQPHLQPILSIISLSVLFIAAGQQIRVVSEKALNFSIVAKIEVFSTLVAFCVSILWAFIKPSVYALVAGVVISEAVKSLLLWVFARNGWRPRFRLKFDEIRRFLNFGGYVMANNFINSFNLQADVLIAGRLFPAATLGIYSLPRTLSLKVATMINPVVSRVGLPLMAKAQNDREYLKSVYLKTIRMTASVNVPIYLGLAVFSQEIISLLFGQKWGESAHLLTFLAFWGLLRSIGNPVGSLLLAVGKADLSFKWNFALLFVIPPALWFFGRSGIQGLAVGQMVLLLILLIPGWYFLVRPNCGAGAWEYFKNLAIPTACAAPSVMVSYYLTSSVGESMFRLTIAVLVSIPIYLILSFLFNKMWVNAIKEIIKT